MVFLRCDAFLKLNVLFSGLNYSFQTSNQVAAMKDKSESLAFCIVFTIHKKINPKLF